MRSALARACQVKVLALQDFSGLTDLGPFQQLQGRRSKDGMVPKRSGVGERAQDKSALVGARMRQYDAAAILWPPPLPITDN